MNNSFFSHHSGDKKDLEFPLFLVSNAVKNVLNVMAGLEAIETVFSEDEDVNLPKISSFLMMIGDCNILMSLKVSESLASTLTSFMTGIKCTDIKDDELYDSISELNNMIAGETKAQLAARGYKLSVLSPFVIEGTKYRLVLKGKVPSILKKFIVSDREFYLSVYFL